MASGPKSGPITFLINISNDYRYLSLHYMSGGCFNGEGEAGGVMPFIPHLTRWVSINQIIFMERPIPRTVEGWAR